MHVTRSTVAECPLQLPSSVGVSAFQSETLLIQFHGYDFSKVLDLMCPAKHSYFNFHLQESCQSLGHDSSSGSARGSSGMGETKLKISDNNNKPPNWLETHRAAQESEGCAAHWVTLGWTHM